MIDLISIQKDNLVNVKIEKYNQTIEIITNDKHNKRHSLDEFPGLRFVN